MPRFKIEIKMRIANGCGDGVKSGIRDSLPKGLVNGGGGAIKMVSNTPEEREPNNGWTGFDWYATWYCDIDLNKLTGT